MDRELQRIGGTPCLLLIINFVISPPLCLDLRVEGGSGGVKNAIAQGQAPYACARFTRARKKKPVRFTPHSVYFLISRSFSFFAEKKPLFFLLIKKIKKNHNPIDNKKKI